MSADHSVSAIILPLRSRCSDYLDAWHYKPACNKIVDWSIARSCNKYEQRDRKGTAEMAEFNAGFLTSSGVKFFMTVALAVTPLTVKNRDVRFKSVMCV